MRRKGREREARTEPVLSLLLLPLLIPATVSDNPETLMSIFSNSHRDLQVGMIRSISMRKLRLLAQDQTDKNEQS